MGHSIATMRTSTKEQRKNRKQVIFARIERELRKHMGPIAAAHFMYGIRSDLHELMEIGHVEGYQCGANDERNKK